MALSGIRVIELAGLAPAPHCGKLLADFGADVIRIDKTLEKNVIDRLAQGKRSIAINLKHEDGRNVMKRICTTADVLIDPFRPGTLEKLFLGPTQLMSINPGLIYARMTGYGQTGPLAGRAGHDINYLAISGLLSMLGRHPDPPTPPVNLLADFAGGGLLTAFSILVALIQRQTTGRGQIIDASLTEGAAYVASWLWWSRDLPGIWGEKRGHNALDGGKHFYNVYKTSDDKFMSVGSLEPKFYADLLKGLNLTDNDLPQFHDDPDAATKKIADIFRTRTRQEWEEVFRRLDACVEPVLEMDEAAQYPHNRERHSFISVDNKSVAPSRAPKLSDMTLSRTQTKAPNTGEHTKDILKQSGFSTSEIEYFLQSGVVEQHIINTKSNL